MVERARPRGSYHGLAMRILGVDPGERRTGVALSDPTGVLATPLTVLSCKSREEEFAAIAQLAIQHQVERIIVGYPRSLDGSIGPQARRVERYADRLAERVTVPVSLWDERFSTVEAEALVHETGRHVQRERIDSLAAAVVLQDYLEAHRSNA